MDIEADCDENEWYHPHDASARDFSCLLHVHGKAAPSHAEGEVIQLVEVSQHLLLPPERYIQQTRKAAVMVLRSRGHCREGASAVNTNMNTKVRKQIRT